MGAKVQCNGYLPACYHMKDLNDDVRSTVCSQFFEDRMLRGPHPQYCNGFMQLQTDGYSEHDKEVLKQTMLKHEAIFRKQVSELHRLYQVQKDLMDDLKRKETSKYCLPMEEITERQHLFQMMSADSHKIWQASMPSVVRSSCSRQSASDTENTQSPMDILKETGTQRVPTPSHGIKQEASELLNLKRNKGQRKSIDLQLPADEYIDIEDELSAEEIKVPDPDVVPEIEVKLTLGTGYNASVKSDHKKSGFNSGGDFHAHKVPGLNGPHQGSFNKVVATSSFGVPEVFSGEIQARQLSLDRSAGGIGLPGDCNSDDSHRHWNFLESECKGARGDWHPSNLTAGHYKSPGTPFPQGYRIDRQFDIKKSRELPAFVLHEQRQKESWFRDTGMLKMNVVVPNPKKAMIPSTILPGISVVAQSDLSNGRSVEFSSWRSLNASSQLPFGIQSQAFFDRPTGRGVPGETTGTPFQSSEIYKEKWYLGGNSGPYEGLCHEVPYRKGFDVSKPDASGSHVSSFIAHKKPNRNAGECSSYGHPEDNGPRKSGFDCLDFKVNNSVCLSRALSDGSGDDSGPQSRRDLFFGKAKDFSPLGEQCMLQIEVKKQPNKAAHVDNGSVQTGESPLQVFHQALPSIDLEKPSNVEYYMAGQTCDAAKLSLLKSGAGFFQGCVFLPAEKNELVVVPEAYEARSFLSNGFNFLKEPFADKLLSEPSKDWSKFDDSKKHIQEFQESTPGDFKLQRIETQIVVCQASRCSAHQEITSNAPAFHEERSSCLEDSAHEFAHSFKESLPNEGVTSKEHRLGQSEHKTVASATEEVPQNRRKIPQDRRIDFSNVERKVGGNHRIDLGLRGDSATLQTPVMPIQMVQKNSCIEESVKVDCAIGGNNLCSRAGDCSPESSWALVAAAAEVLMIISVVGQEKSDCVPWNEPGVTLSDSLKWFSDVVCSDAAELESDVGISGGKSDYHPQSSDGEDFFESMTLMLRDTKMEEGYCYEPQPSQKLKGPETDASPAPNQSSRRTSRRGRQQRDFQRDILPGLMSLSRHEVTEDMQTLVGLMRASGCFWQTGLARRNGPKNGWGSPARGRRLRGVAMEMNGAVLAALRSSCEDEVDEHRGLKGFSWGKTTRRRRRIQRCAKVVAPTSCTTKKL